MQPKLEEVGKNWDWEVLVPPRHSGSGWLFCAEVFLLLPGMRFRKTEQTQFMGGERRRCRRLHVMNGDRSHSFHFNFGRLVLVPKARFFFPRLSRYALGLALAAFWSSLMGRPDYRRGMFWCELLLLWSIVQALGVVLLSTSSFACWIRYFMQMSCSHLGFKFLSLE